MSGAVTGPHSYRLRRHSLQVPGGSAPGLATQLSSCFLWCHYSFYLSCDCCRSSCSHLSLASGHCWGLGHAGGLALLLTLFLHVYSYLPLSPLPSSVPSCVRSLLGCFHLMTFHDFCHLMTSLAATDFLWVSQFKEKRNLERGVLRKFLVGWAHHHCNHVFCCWPSQGLITLYEYWVNLSKFLHLSEPSFIMCAK